MVEQILKFEPFASLGHGQNLKKIGKVFLLKFRILYYWLLKPDFMYDIKPNIFEKKALCKDLLELHEAGFTVLFFNNILIWLWNCRILSNEGSYLEKVAYHVLSRHLSRSQECSCNCSIYTRIDWVFLLHSLKYLRCSFCRNYQSDLSKNYLTYSSLNVSYVLLYPVLIVLDCFESLMKIVGTSIWGDIFYLTCAFMYWILSFHK